MGLSVFSTLTCGDNEGAFDGETEGSGVSNELICIGVWIFFFVGIALCTGVATGDRDGIGVSAFANCVGDSEEVFIVTVKVGDMVSTTALVGGEVIFVVTASVGTIVSISALVGGDELDFVGVTLVGLTTGEALGLVVTGESDGCMVSTTNLVGGDDRGSVTVRVGAAVSMLDFVGATLAGLITGDILGLAVTGEALGFCVGLDVKGESVGELVAGDEDGCSAGLAVTGETLGLAVSGEFDGCLLGVFVIGEADGCRVDEKDGSDVTAFEGGIDGVLVKTCIER